MNELLSKRIRFFRKQLGLTQEELAEKCNVTSSCVSRWESGRWTPSMQNLLILSKVFNVTLNDLCEVDNPVIDKNYINQFTQEIQTFTEEENKFVLKMISELKRLLHK